MSYPPPPTQSSDPEATRSILKTLPPEIMETIYNYALTQPDSYEAVVEVTPTGYSRPPLLQTCKAIRREALKIWYYNTNFHIKITYFDCATFQRWKKSFASLGLMRSMVAIHSTPIWNPRWKNLLVWLRLYHAGIVHGRCPPPVYLMEQSDEVEVELKWYVLGMMFDVAKAMRGATWAKVEAVMVDMRPALIAADAKWKN